MNIALYRKYRPKIFAEVIGQEHITKTLQNEIKTGHIVHSYLFTGSRGIGKTTIARLLGKTLNCENIKDEEPCNECVNCKAINQGNALNIIEIDAASHTGVDNVRDKIIENVRFAPTGAKYKVFIIDEAHMLSTAAFNALLKTLEEPPEYAIFVLATTEIHKIPATILSRCQRFDFKKPTISQIKKRLKIISKEESVKIDDAVLERVAYLSEGGLRDAESLFGQLIALGLKEIKENDADLVLPKSDFGLALEFAEGLVLKEGREAMLIVGKINEGGGDFKYFTDNTIEILRKILYFKITEKQDDFLTEDINKKIEMIAKGADRENLIKILDIALKRRADIGNLNIVSLPLELLVAEVCGEPDFGNQKSEIGSHKSKSVEQKLNQGNNNMPFEKQNAFVKSPPPNLPPSTGGGIREKISPPPNLPPSTRGGIRGFVPPSCNQGGGQEGDLLEFQKKWPQVLEKIKEYNHSLPFILNTAKPSSFDGQNLILAIKFKLHKEKLEDPKNYSILTSVLKFVYNMDIKVKAEVDENIEIDISCEEMVDVAKEFESRD